VLPNGLRIVTERMPHSHTFSVGFFAAVGSIGRVIRLVGSVQVMAVWFCLNVT